MKTTYIATCRDWPQGNADLQALAAALDATLAPWQDINPANARAVIPLAAWDYSTQPDDYLAWLAALEAAQVRVINPPALQRWNLDKRYLCELAAQGLAVTPSIALLPGDDWTAQIAASGWDNPVIKPLIGQSGRGVRRLHGEPPTLADYPQGVLLQPFMASEIGEVCLVYLGGTFSHAAHRRPAPQEWRANSAYGVEILPIEAEPAWLKRAEAVLPRLPVAPLYARIDGLIDARGAFLINEVELIEPALYLSLHPPAQERLRALIAAVSSLD